MLPHPRQSQFDVMISQDDRKPPLGRAHIVLQGGPHLWEIRRDIVQLLDGARSVEVHRSGFRKEVDHVAIDDENAFALRSGPDVADEFRQEFLLAEYLAARRTSHVQIRNDVQLVERGYRDHGDSDYIADLEMQSSAADQNLAGDI